MWVADLKNIRSNPKFNAFSESKKFFDLKNTSAAYVNFVGRIDEELFIDAVQLPDSSYLILTNDGYLSKYSLNSNKKLKKGQAAKLPSLEFTQLLILNKTQSLLIAGTKFMVVDNDSLSFSAVIDTERNLVYRQRNVFEDNTILGFSDKDVILFKFNNYKIIDWVNFYYKQNKKDPIVDVQVMNEKVICLTAGKSEEGYYLLYEDGKPDLSIERLNIVSNDAPSGFSCEISCNLTSHPLNKSNAEMETKRQAAEQVKKIKEAQDAQREAEVQEAQRVAEENQHPAAEKICNNPNPIAEKNTSTQPVSESIPLAENKIDSQTGLLRRYAPRKDTTQSFSLMLKVFGIASMSAGVGLVSLAILITVGTLGLGTPLSIVLGVAGGLAFFGGYKTWKHAKNTDADEGKKNKVAYCG